MTKWQGTALAAALTLFAPAAMASQVVYEYHIEHPRYGTIGTYTNTVDNEGAAAEVHSDLRVAVKVLGIVMYREEGTRTEQWRDDRLVGFDAVTVTNGDSIKVHGEAKGDTFELTTPTGKIDAPPQVHPSNPWAQHVLETDCMMSTKTGHIEPVNVSGGNVQPVTLDGKELQLHHYDVVGSKHWQVWLDDRGVVVAFRTEEDGSPVDFILSHPPVVKPGNQAQNQ
ncbi:MAG TPA: DUF6134 family protein [Stellaceae bacterium]|nr:DUF6134 family protein [Stellaceae bacterium]